MIYALTTPKVIHCYINKALTIFNLGNISRDDENIWGANRHGSAGDMLESVFSSGNKS